MEAVLQSPDGRMVLGTGVMTIGRSKDNQLVVHSATTSSHHAEIHYDNNSYSLIDLGSTNGTFVNGRKLHPLTSQLLQSGDSIHFGNMMFRYEASSSALRDQLVQESSLDDEPTVQFRASTYEANGLSEKWGDQPPTPYSTPTSKQHPAPFFPALQQPNTPPAMDAITGYGMPVYQPAPYPPALQQPNTQAIERSGGYNMPVQQQPYTPLPVKPKSSNRLKILLIVLLVVLVVCVSGGGIAAYMLTRPQPLMNITSTYSVGSIPAGSTGTVLHVSARSFSGSSAITFLLDNSPVVSGQNVSSDANGNVRADLTITTAWTAGKHTLTARDASGYATKAGVTVEIVPQGQAHTPGPNGAPPDDMSFTLNTSVQFQDAGTGQQNGSLTQTLIVTGRPDPSGGTVCEDVANGQPQTYLGNTNNGLTYHETYVASCSGTYKGGKLTYTETITSDKVDYSDGVSCTARTPYVFEHLEGTFTSQNAISGTASADSVTANCNQGVGTVQSNASKGSWSAQI